MIGQPVHHTSMKKSGVLAVALLMLAACLLVLPARQAAGWPQDPMAEARSLSLDELAELDLKGVKDIQSLEAKIGLVADPKKVGGVNLREAVVSAAMFDKLLRFPNIVIINFSKATLDRDALEKLHNLQGIQMLALSNVKLADEHSNAIGRLPGLKQIILRGATLTEPLMLNLRRAEKLEFLDLRSSNATDDLIKPLAGHPALERITLEDTQVTSKVAGYLVSMPRFKRIKLNGPRFNNDVVAEIAKAAPGSALEEIDLSTTLIDDKGVAGMASWAHLKSLMALDLSGTKIADLDVKTFKVLEERIETLYVSYTALSDNGLKALSQLNKLDTLNVSYTKITSKGISYLKDPRFHPAKNRHNRILMVSAVGTDIDDESMKHFSKLRQLYSMDLRKTKITSEGLKYFAGNHNGYLFALDVDDTAIDDDGLRAISELKNLTIASFKKTRVTAKGIEQLKTARPMLQIHSDNPP